MPLGEASVLDNVPEEDNTPKIAHDEPNSGEFTTNTNKFVRSKTVKESTTLSLNNSGEGELIKESSK